MMTALVPESGCPLEDFRVSRGEETYVVRVVADQIRIGRQLPDRVVWREIAIPVSELGGEARRALAHGDVTCPALLIGLRYLVAAAVTPGSDLNHRSGKGSTR